MSERAQALEAALRETAHALRRLNDLDPTQHAMVCSTLHHIDQALAAPPVGVSPQPDTRRDCTCLGTCRGAEGLGPRWKCALESPASLAPVEPTPEPTPDAPVCAWREGKRFGSAYATADCEPLRMGLDVLRLRSFRFCPYCGKRLEVGTAPQGGEQ